ncbi:MAG: VOC family protein [Actinomycetota bacterium]
MVIEGIQGLHVETRSYGATAAFWASLGFKSTFEIGHGSGQWVHPGGGPYVFFREQHDAELVIRPVLRVPDPAAFAPDREPDFAQPFTSRHWGVAEALIRDPDGRTLSLEGPIPQGASAPDGPGRQGEAGG